MVISLNFLPKLRALPKWIFAAVAALIVAAVAITAWQLHSRAQEAKWNSAIGAFQKADYESANKDLKGLGIPSSPERLRVYSQTKLALRDLPAALVGYQKLQAAQPDPSTQLIIGNIYNEQKKYDDAAKIYRQVIASNSNNVQAYVNLSTLYKLQGDINQARSVAGDAVAANPSNATLLELRISMLMDDKNGQDYKDAVNTLKKVNPEDPLLAALK